MNAAVRTKAYRLPLRSKFHDWLHNNPQRVATAQQWLGMLNNLQSVRQEEIACAGIRGLLNRRYQPNDRVPLDELMPAIDEELRQCAPTIAAHWKFGFRPSLEMKTMIDQRPKRVEAKAKRFVEKAENCFQHPSIGYWIIRTFYEDLATIAPNWIALDEKGKMLINHDRHGGWFSTAIEALDEMDRAIRKRFDEFGSENPDTLYDQYALMGGKNYQEWFITLPAWPLPYCDGHFKLKQLLVHIRTTERLDHDGQTLFMVEEIQSPWHADIHKHGSTTDKGKIGQDDLVAAVSFSKDWHELAIKAAICLAIKRDFTRIGFTTGKQQCERWWDMEGLMNLYDQQIPKCLKKIATQYGCTDGWATIDTRKPKGKIRYVPQKGWIAEIKDIAPIYPPVKNKEIALFYLNSRSTPIQEQIRVLTISSTLTRAVKAGEVPLFGW